MGLALSIQNNIVMDGCVQLFGVNNDFTHEHSIIVNRIFLN